MIGREADQPQVVEIQLLHLALFARCFDHGRL